MSAWPEHALAAASHRDPYPYYLELARQGWARDQRLGLWLAASHAAASAVLACPACRVRPLDEPAPAALAGLALGETFGRWLRMSEAPIHAPLRAAVAASLAAQEDERAQRRARDLARGFLAGAAPDGARLDALVDFLPAATLASLLGWPERSLLGLSGQVAAWCRAVAADAGAVEREAGEAACLALHAELAALEDAGWLARWRQEFGELGEDALRANLLGALFQSRDAGAGLLAAGIAWRCEGPWDWREAGEWRRRLRADPVLHHTRRFVAEDATLAGQPLKAGDQVLVLLAAAARDPAGPGESMDFGRGRHGCPGERLALAIARGALAALEEIGPDWRALGGGMVFRGPPNVRMRRFGAGDGR
ncbi:cytochrome [Chromobacterium phragmitis]|uniref:cytochrome P450 n=1 Tax=Chromobacterium phragmitis TaxID=2202141 RepID=UPI000DEC09A3|nr:cytochrome P450 [Chromobacterium phragmitis]AXE29667.1 cytochrome [Chromobacterium phragmitis]